MVCCIIVIQKSRQMQAYAEQAMGGRFCGYLCMNGAALDKDKFAILTES